MAIAPTFWGIVDKGKLLVKDKDKFQKYLNTLEGDVKIIVHKFFKQRTTPQNSYYWALLKILSMYTGYDPDELHILFRFSFLTDPNSKIGIPRSTTSLSTAEFVEYIDRIRRWSAEFFPEVILPDPDGFYQITNEYDN